MRNSLAKALAALLLAHLVAGLATAALIVDPPQAITRQVTVQLIQTALDNGSSPATVFGDVAQRADIEAGIDAIWAQAGIDINILPNITRYNNTFAYQGNAGSGTRPSGDLTTILSNASTARVLSSDPLTLNLILVNVVPAFAPLSEDTAAGLARVPGNGIAGFAGDNLLTFDNGRDVIAGVMAHEIGHNLGLNHTASGIENLMSPNGRSQQLNVTQIATARNSSFSRAISNPTTIVGDYNKNGAVDAADYVVWRNTVGQSGSGLPADGDANGSIGTNDYTVWRTRFGRTTASGVTITATIGDAVTLFASTGVPEPNMFALLSIAVIIHFTGRRNRSHRAG